jgi:enterobactin synthetase component D / holo-[acyl-carrier protein] synthase
MNGVGLMAAALLSSHLVYAAMQNLAPVSPFVDVDAIGVRNRAILPAGVSQFTCVSDDGVLTPMPWDELAVPYELRNAPPIRQRQFRAGRFCAAQALCALDPDRAVPPLARSSTGAPVWPAGITGSITHSRGFTSAAVAHTVQFASIGIDTETIMSPAQARNVSLSVAWACEVAEARKAGCNHLEALTLVFSAKESIFKCFSATAGFFDYRDVRIVEVDGNAGTFTARVMRTLSPQLPLHALLHGRFAIEAPWVHTGIARAVDVREADA